MTYKKFRLDLEGHEYLILKTILEKSSYTLDSRSDKSLLEKIENPKEIKHSSAKSDAAYKATMARKKIAMGKIKEAHEALELDLKRGFIKKISYYAISKKSGVHINTVKKYITLDEVK